MRSFVAALSLGLCLLSGCLLSGCLLSGPAQALSLQWDDSSGSWCAGTATCVDSPQAGGDYVAQAVDLAMGSDTVDLFTGELRLSADDVRIPGLHGLDLDLQRTYSSKIADELGNTVETSWAGLGWQVLPGGRLRFEPSTGQQVWLEIEDSYQFRYLDQAGRPWLLLDYQAFAYDASGFGTTATGHRLFERDAGGDVSCEVWDHHPDVSGEQFSWIRRDQDFAGRPLDVSTGVAPTVSASCPATASAAVTWTHDAVPSGSTWTGSNLAGHPVQVQDEGGVVAWGYDQQGRVTDSHHTWTDWPAVGVDVGTTYDSLGRLDAGGAGEDTVPIITASSWLPGGHPATLSYGNGVTATWTEDGLGRTSSVATSGIIDGTTPADLDEALSYDGNGDVETVTVDGLATDTYSYDEIGRLLQVAYDDGSTIDYGWDDLGDLVYREASATGLSSLNFGSLGSTRYYGHVSGWEYDGAGQVTATDTTTLSWDATGKPATIQDTDWTEISYDYAGRRSVVRSCAGDSSCAGAQHWSQYVYDASGRVLARFNAQSPGSVANSFLSELYVYAGKQLVAVVDFNASHPQGAVLWLHTDGQGSLRRVSDSMADVVRSVSWTPFGAVRSDTGVTNQDGLAYAWQSAAYDKQPVVDVGLRARHADYGWFLSPDPVAWGDPMDPQSFHRSQYARGSPMTLVDPSGGGPELAWLSAEAAFTFVDLTVTGEAALGVYQGSGEWGELGIDLVLTGMGMYGPGGGATLWVKGARKAEELAAASRGVATRVLTAADLGLDAKVLTKLDGTFTVRAALPRLA